jgi:hypothetical protein
MRPFSRRGFYVPQSEMNRLFDEMFGGLSSSRRRSGGQQRGQGVPSGHQRSTWSRRTTTWW